MRQCYTRLPYFFIQPRSQARLVGIRGVERGGLQTRGFSKSGSFDTAVPWRHLSATRYLHQHQLVIP